MLAPSALDHILLGCSDLESGIAFVEERTGARPQFGGVHPGRGTRNAVLPLGERQYLEVLAPDPEQREVQPWLVNDLPLIRALAAPRIVGWCVHPQSIERAIASARASGFDAYGPSAHSRTRGDGTIVKWKLARLADDRHGLLPFFIEWDASSAHPAAGAPALCALEHFSASASDARELGDVYRRLGVDMPVEPGEAALLTAAICGPRGTLHISSGG